MVSLVEEYGTMWAFIARKITAWRQANGLAGRRSDNNVKNAFNLEKSRLAVYRPPQRSQCRLSTVRVVQRPRAGVSLRLGGLLGARPDFSVVNSVLKRKRVVAYRIAVVALRADEVLN